MSICGETAELLAASLPDDRVGDRLQLPSQLRIAEDPPSDSPAVQPAVRSKGLGAELSGDLRERRLSRLYDEAGKLVGIDDRVPPASQLDCNGGLPAGDSTREANDVNTLLPISRFETRTAPFGVGPAPEPESPIRARMLTPALPGDGLGFEPAA